MGPDRLAGTVTNRQSYPLQDAILAFGEQVYQLGTMAPGATVRVELVSGSRKLSGLLNDKRRNYLTNQPWDRDTKLNRADLLLALMFHESERNRSSDQALSNSTLHDLDLTGQLALERPMLVAQVKRPGAQLALDNAPSPPKIDQTTVMRVILPLKRK
jgi:hypothetical protein